MDQNDHHLSNKAEDDIPSHSSISSHVEINLDEKHSIKDAIKNNEINLDGTLPKEAEAPEHEPEYMTGLPLIAVIGCITASIFLILLDNSILSTAVPKITNDFDSLPDIGWYVSSYQLASASLQPLIGKFYTYFKLKWTFLIFLVIFELGSLICGVSISSTMLIIGRAIAGLGCSGLYNGGLSILSGAAAPEKRPLLMGIMMGVSQIGLVCGPLVGGALTEYATWRWCFYINLPIGAVAIGVLLLCKIPEQMPKPPFRQVVMQKDVWHKFDITGAILFAPAVIQLLLALQYGGNKFAWNNATVIGLFCGAGATSIVFVLWEWRAGEVAMVPLSMIKKSVVWSSSVNSALLFSGLFLSSYFIPLYFQAIKGATPFQSGVYILPTILSQLISVVAIGVIIGKISRYLPAMIVSAVIATVGYGLTSTFSPYTSTGQWIGYQILIGIGRGAGMQVPMLAISNGIAPAHISTAMAIMVFIQNLGAAIFITIGNAILLTSLRSTIPEHAPAANADAIIAAGATAFREFVAPTDLSGVLDAYAISIDRTLFLATGLSGLSFFIAWFMGNPKLKKSETKRKKNNKDEEDTPK